ncbi:hypothetical protein [Siminovitchia sp. 179-K 8D1 HS]|uniref:hypothetical protein n=1 Tax=Siminovitchia sp. 179-K 8D1 HS TaxID=3142385 RepID=UPI0039A1F619
MAKFRVDISAAAGRTVVRFYIERWQTLQEPIRPVGYGIQTYIVTTKNMLFQEKELPELYMKFGEEVKLWRMLRRFTTEVRTELDEKLVDRASKIQAYQIGYNAVVMDLKKQEICVWHGDEVRERVPLEMLRTSPAFVFKVIKEAIFV